MPETVIPRTMLQGANETGDYFWDVWREPNDHAARYSRGPRRFFCPILGGRRDRAGSLVVQHGRQPPFRLFHRPTLPRRVVFDLIAFDLAYTEIVAFGICEI